MGWPCIYSHSISAYATNAIIAATQNIITALSMLDFIFTSSVIAGWGLEEEGIRQPFFIQISATRKGRLHGLHFLVTSPWLTVVPSVKMRELVLVLVTILAGMGVYAGLARLICRREWDEVYQALRTR